MVQVGMLWNTGRDVGEYRWKQWEVQVGYWGIQKGISRDDAVRDNEGYM
jgi:hypothetical protein